MRKSLLASFISVVFPLAVPLGIAACGEQDVGDKGLPRPVPVVDDDADIGAAGLTSSRAIYTGRIDRPTVASDAAPRLVVSAGLQTTALASDGTFQTTLKDTGVALVSVELEDGTPVMLSLFPKSPRLAAENPIVDTESTALALLFMQPGLIVTDPIISAVLQAIAKDMPETRQVVAVLDEELARDPRALANPGPRLTSVVSAMTGAFLQKLESAPDAAGTGAEEDVEKTNLPRVDLFVETDRGSPDQDQLIIDQALDLRNAYAALQMKNPKPRYVLVFRDEGADSDAIGLDHFIDYVPSFNFAVMKPGEFVWQALRIGGNKFLELFKPNPDYHPLEELEESIARDGKATVALEGVTTATRLRTYALGNDLDWNTKRGFIAAATTLAVDVGLPLFEVAADAGNIQWNSMNTWPDEIKRKRRLAIKCLGERDLSDVKDLLAETIAVRRGEATYGEVIVTLVEATTQLDFDCFADLIPDFSQGLQATVKTKLTSWSPLLKGIDLAISGYNAAYSIAGVVEAWRGLQSVDEYQFIYSRDTCAAFPDRCGGSCAGCPAGEVCDPQTLSCVPPDPGPPSPTTSCTDADGDGQDAYSTPDCPEGTDHCDHDANNWSTAGCTCTDTDHDRFGTNCDHGPDCDDADASVHANCLPAKPTFSPAPALADTLPYLQRASFAGGVLAPAGLKTLEIRVTGPRGTNVLVFTTALSGTSADLSRYYFDSTASYAGLAATYTVELRVTDMANRVASNAQTIQVVCTGTGMAPVISVTPSTATVGAATSVAVTVGTSSSPSLLTVQCTSPGSQYGGGSVNATFRAGLGVGGRAVSPSFTWTAAGTHSIYCSTFDPNGLGECKASRSISVSAAVPPPLPPPPVGDTEGPQGVVIQPNVSVVGGSVLNVGWGADDLLSGIAELYIDFTVDGGASFSPAAGGLNLAATLAPDTTGGGSFAWSVPDVDSDQAAFRMTMRDNVGNQSVLMMPTFSIVRGCPALDSPYLGDPGVSAPLGAYDVTWLAVGDATSYELQESSSSSFDSATSRTLAHTSYAVTGRANGTWYYRVRALSACAQSGWSLPVSIDVVVDHPPLVPHASSPADGATGVSRTPTLQWSGGDAEGGVEYAVWFGTDPGDLGVARAFGPAAQVVFGSSVAANTTFYWRVRARDMNGATTDGPLWSFTTAASFPDLVAADLRVVGNVVPDGNVTLELQVDNRGTEPALPCFADFFLSGMPGSTENMLFGSRTTIPALAAGASTTVSKSVTLEGLQQGTSYIVARVDTTDGSLENVLINNVTSEQVSYVDDTPPTIDNVELLWGAGPAQDQFQTGHTYRIVSQIHDDVSAPCASLDLDYSTDAGATWLPIALGAACTVNASQTQFWTVPAGAPPTSNTRIRVMAFDANGNAASAFTSPFTLIDGTGPAVTVTSPNGHETLRLGDNVTVSWMGSDPTGVSSTRVYLHYGTQVDQLQYLQGNPGQYTWAVPANAGYVTDEARIRVVLQDAQGNEATDFSDAPFRIIDASAPPAAPWGMPLAITSTATCSQMGCFYGAQMPALTVDSAGDTHLAYLYRQSYTDNSGTSFVAERVYYKKKHATTWSAPELIADLGTQSSNPTLVQALDIAVDSTKRPHVAWEYGGTGSSNWFSGDIYATSRNSGTWTAPTNLSNNASQSRAPRLVVSSGDDIHVFWRDGRTRDPVAGTWSGTTSLYYRSRPASSSTWGTLTASSFQLQGSTFDAARGSEGRPQLALIGADGALRTTAWTGSAWAALRAFGTCNPLSSVGKAPTLAAASAGGVDALFIDNDGGNRLKYAFSDGVQQLGCADISANAVGQSVVNAVVRQKASGLPTSVWIEEGTQSRVLARRMLTRPSVWSSPALISLATQVPLDGQLAYAVGLNDMAHVVWQGFANGRSELFYNAADFTLDTDAPSVQVSSPAPNEVIATGSAYELAWQASDALGVSSIQVRVSFDNGATWQDIASALPGNATHTSWSVPSTAPGPVLIQVVVSDAAGNEGVGLASASISNLQP